MAGGVGPERCALTRRGWARTVGSEGLEEGCEDQGLHSHELDEDVQRGAARVLERVADRVADHRRLVRVAALASQRPRVLRRTRLKHCQG